MDAQGEIQKLIKEKLTQHQLKNPAFSLRAFSNRVGTTPATLSRILSGKRRISEKLARKIVERLALGFEESSQILSLFPAKRSRSANERHETQTMNQLTMDHFHVVSDWYYFAVRALLRTKGAKASAPWIAARLGITKTEAAQALDRLARLEMITTNQDGQTQATDVAYRSPDGVSHSLIRRNHAQHLDLARESLDIDAMELRDFTNMTLAIDVRKIALARQAIRRFHQEISALMESESPDEVYKLSIQFFPVSRMSEKKLKTQN